MAEGESHARLLQPRLAKIQFEVAYSSPLVRAERTGQLAGFPDLQLTPLLVEWDYGSYDGITSKQIREQRPDWDLWRDGAPGGESPATVLDRARRFLELALRHRGPVVAFSHGHFIRALAVAFLELPTAAGGRLNLETTALSVLRSDGGKPILELWNDTGHLPGAPG